MSPLVWVGISVAIAAVLVSYFVAGFASAKSKIKDGHENDNKVSKFESLEDVIDFDGESEESVYESKKRSKEGD